MSIVAWFPPVLCVVQSVYAYTNSRTPNSLSEAVSQAAEGDCLLLHVSRSDEAAESQSRPDSQCFAQFGHRVDDSFASPQVNAVLFCCFLLILATPECAMHASCVDMLDSGVAAARFSCSLLFPPLFAVLVSCVAADMLLRVVHFVV